MMKDFWKQLRSRRDREGGEAPRLSPAFTTRYACGARLGLVRGDRCRGNQSEAAELLGMRRTLVSRVTEHGLTRARKRDGDS